MYYIFSHVICEKGPYREIQSNENILIFKKKLYFCWIIDKNEGFYFKETHILC